MGRFDAATYLANVAGFDDIENKSPTNVHAITARVVESSSDGSVVVDMDGIVFNAEDNQYVQIPTLGGLREGDDAAIILTGQDGKAQVPLAIGSVGSVDHVYNVAENASEDAQIANRAANEAKTDAAIARQSANSAAEDAVAAKRSAETAEKSANDANTNAAAAKKAADDAVADAKVANDNAVIAKESADQAIKDAADAATAADEAKTASDEAKTAATNAVESAENAKTSADEAKKDATIAKTSAASAESSANSALIRANTALDAANSAQESSGIARSNAEEAQRMANSASLDAESARTLALSAQSFAEGAQASADAAMRQASDATASANAANAAANGAVTSLSTVQDVIGTVQWAAEHNKESMSDYINSHLALMSDGLHVVPAANGYYVVLSNEGMGVYNPQSVLVGWYGSQVQVGMLQGTHMEADGSRLSFFSANYTYPRTSSGAVDYSKSVDGKFQGEVAYIAVDDNGESVFYMNRAVVVSELRFGDWAWHERENRNLALKWIGGDI